MLYTKKAVLRMASANTYKPGHVYKTAHAKQPVTQQKDFGEVVEGFSSGTFVHVLIDITSARGRPPLLTSQYTTSL